MRWRRALALACLVGASPSTALPATYATEWLTPATDPRNRLNIAILGDGYTADAASQAQLTRDATSLLAGLLTTRPHALLRDLFTARLVHVVSNQSGASFGSAGGVRDTALGARFGCGGIERLVCVDVSKALLIAAEHFPEFTFVVVVVNDEEYGGSGGSVAVASVNPAAREIAVHELGHLMGGLADEYSDATPGYPPCDPTLDCLEPNATLRAAREAVKWRSWIPDTTPVPTPAGRRFRGVGLFEGARYQAKGVYRPTESGCLMREAGLDFCDVCSEALTTGLLGRLALVDAAVVSDSFASCAPGAFSLDPLPLGDAGTLSFRWSVDGAARAETGPALSLAPGALSEGPHAVAVALAAASPLVRDDPLGALADTAAWTVQVGPCAGVIASPAAASVPPRGSIPFSATGGSGGYSFSLAANRSGGAITAGGDYTAGPLGDVTDVLRVADSSGGATLENITVTGGARVDPPAPALPPRAAQTFRASGGSGQGFTWSLAANGSGATLDPDRGAYQAGAIGGTTDRVEVVDSLGNRGAATVTVTAGVRIAPPAAKVAAGSRQTFAAAGGSGSGYAWSLSSSGSGGSIDPQSGAYAAGATAPSTDVVAVADSLGNGASATIEVAPPDGRCGCSSAGPPGGALALVSLLWLVRRRGGAGSPT